MTDVNRVAISPALVRTLAEFAALPLLEDSLAKIAPVLQDMLANRAALDALDVSGYEPASAFDPAWQ